MLKMAAASSRIQLLRYSVSCFQSIGFPLTAATRTAHPTTATTTEIEGIPASHRKKDCVKIPFLYGPLSPFDLNSRCCSDLMKNLSSVFDQKSNNLPSRWGCLTGVDVAVTSLAMANYQRIPKARLFTQLRQGQSCGNK